MKLPIRKEFMGSLFEIDLTPEALCELLCEDNPSDYIEENDLPLKCHCGCEETDEHGDDEVFYVTCANCGTYLGTWNGSRWEL